MERLDSPCDTDEHQTMDRTRPDLVEAFVTDYLKTRNRPDTLDTRTLVDRAVRAFNPDGDVSRADLFAHLDARWDLKQINWIRRFAGLASP